MKRKAILFALVISTAFAIKAQDYVRPSEQQQQQSQQPGTIYSRNKKFSVGLSLGPAIPLRDYGSTNAKGSFWDFTSIDSTRLQGFAKPGFHINMTLAYQVNDIFGIMFMFGSSTNTFDVSTFSSTIGYSASTTTGSYGAEEFLIGPFVSYSAGPHWKFKAKALIGFVSIAYPEVNVIVNDTLIDTFDFQGGGGLALCLGAGIEYSLSPSASLILNVDYTTANVQYGSSTITYNFTGYYPYPVNHPYDQTNMTTGILKPTIGILLYF